MKELIKYQTEEGNIVYVEVNSQESNNNRGMQDVRALKNKAEEIVTTAKESFEKSLESIYVISEKVCKNLKKLEPKQVEVEFGVTFSAEAGAIITSIGGEVNFKIKLTWENNKDKSNVTG